MEPPRWPGAAPLLLLLLLTQAAGSAHAQVVGTSGPSCAVPRPPPPPELPPCNETEGMGLAEAQDLAVKYAPTVHFHPLEKYYIQVRSARAPRRPQPLHDLPHGGAARGRLLRRRHPRPAAAAFAPAALPAAAGASSLFAARCPIPIQPSPSALN